MTVTIDRAGRVVIPKSIRDRLNLVPGSELGIDVKGSEFNLALNSVESRLKEKRGVLIFDGRSDSDLDIAEFINHERAHGAGAKFE